MAINNIIDRARRRFDAELHSDRYRSIHSDQEHLTSLVALFGEPSTGRYFDLGTGNGYVAFELAERFPKVEVIGIDIASNAIISNNRIAHDQNRSNSRYLEYDGVHLPFEDDTFNGGISRYAMHHFPNINKSVSEISRVLTRNGFFVYSDPITRDDDTSDFINHFQKLVNDGHQRFYTELEINEIFHSNGLKKETTFTTRVRYPRQMDDRYQALIDNAPRKTLANYNIEIVDREIYVTVECANILFRKSS